MVVVVLLETVPGVVLETVVVEEVVEGLLETDLLEEVVLGTVVVVVEVEVVHPGTEADLGTVVDVVEEEADQTVVVVDTAVDSLLEELSVDHMSQSPGSMSRRMSPHSRATW